MTDLKKIAQQFSIPPVLSIKPLGEGNINRTYLVCCQTEQKENEKKFVFQSLNLQITPEPEKILKNILLCDVSNSKMTFAQKVQFCPLKERKEKDSEKDSFLYFENEEVFRMMNYVEGKIFQNFKALSNATRNQVAYELGKGWAKFHQQTSELDPKDFEIVLPYFHQLERVYQNFERVLEEKTPEREKLLKDPLVQQWVDFALARKEDFSFVQSLPLRVTHNDTKLNNCIFDPNTSEVLCLIDLDTIQPGYFYYDVGDGIRSGANLAGEEERDLGKVAWDQEIYSQILKGYLQNAPFLTPEEKESLKDAPKRLALELGIRFLTDYLQGDIYFKNEDKNRPKRNLERAGVQLVLVQDFEKNQNLFFKIFDQIF